MWYVKNNNGIRREYFEVVHDMQIRKRILKLICYLAEEHRMSIELKSIKLAVVENFYVQ